MKLAQLPLLTGEVTCTHAFLANRQSRLSRPKVCTCSSSGGAQSAGGSFHSSYSDGEGRKKASLQDAYVQHKRRLLHRDLYQHMEQPWSIGWQQSERNLVWNDDLKARLVKRVASEELECTDAEVDNRFGELLSILPGLAERVSNMKASTLAVLLRNPQSLAQRLLELKGVFPGANVERMVLRSVPQMLGLQIDAIKCSADELRALLPDVDVDRLCEAHPSMLDVPSFKDALSEVKRMMPHVNIATALNTQPEIIFSCQRHNLMIPYDPVP